MISMFLKWILSLFNKNKIKGDKMNIISINNSDPNEYHVQTNNERDPFITCFPTSMINACKTIRSQNCFPTSSDRTGGYTQLEDQFDWFLHNNDECIDYWLRSEFKSYLSDKNNDPRELYDVEVYCFNKWMQEDVCRVQYNSSSNDIVETIKKGGAVVTSGNFCGFGHVIAIVGLTAECENESDISIDNVKDFIILDSYGNPHNKYKPVGSGGKNVLWDKNEFLNIINKGTGFSKAFNLIIFNA
jgi:hypothetical protein